MLPRTHQKCFYAMCFRFGRYGKAYGRMGLAYSSIHKHKEAVDCFKKAIEIEPENESYKSNLQLAEEKLATAGSPGPAAMGLPGMGKPMFTLLTAPWMLIRNICL